MKLATYIDGNERTPYGVLLTRHSVSSSCTIKKEHELDFCRALGEYFDAEDICIPTDRSMPVPFTTSPDVFADFISDHEDEEYVKPYLEDLKYLSEDPCSMGVIYLMGARA